MPRLFSSSFCLSLLSLVLFRCHTPDTDKHPHKIHTHKLNTHTIHLRTHPHTPSASQTCSFCSPKREPEDFPICIRPRFHAPAIRHLACVGGLTWTWMGSRNQQDRIGPCCFVVSFQSLPLLSMSQVEKPVRIHAANTLHVPSSVSTTSLCVCVCVLPRLGA